MKNLNKLLTIFVLLATLSACRKTEVLNVDYSTFNADNPTTNTPLDQWLGTNFLDAYNIEVIYRYNRYYHGNSANVTPSKLENIQPTMQIVLDGFINPYRKVAGEVFTKKYMPKEWVLFGSYQYDDANAPGVAGTAAAGRRITLYGVNDYKPLPAGQFYAWDRHRIMHHEFGHILNQIIDIPTDFEAISRGFYKQPYTSTPTDSARRNGFVSSYASGVSTEDYAETISWLLINGQVWYEDWANFANTAGKSRFIQKQSNVVNYFATLGVNFKELQREVQKYMIGIGRNESKFAYWLNKSRTPLITPAPNPAPAPVPTFKSLTLNPTADYYFKYGSSASFKAVYDAMTANVLAIAPGGRKVNFVRFDFPSTTSTTMVVNYTNSAGTTFNAKYAFNMAITVATGQIKFTVGTPGGTDGEWVANASTLATAVKPLSDYLTGNTFVADWLPVTVTADDYMKFAGFSVLNAPTNYFYGPLAY
ncbi:substrate import-associated zinc metallohydrolase lipoprotein [Pedobacter namyangjuensis]|uniref:substrate import-associated zinc metallohydrolase lipoprotein n=1 Tax=Pedobacter namyangjuensis TaxID=600626 RepID=UPI000DE24F9A|nr:substrate import-associated zinc metallohydrolase lipoprotein [Pedobacter namyangjuensis]